MVAPYPSYLPRGEGDKEGGVFRSTLSVTGAPFFEGNVSLIVQ